MAPEGRWSRPTLPLAAFMLAALVFIASVAISGRQLASQALTEPAGHRTGLWESGQAMLEAARLRTELYRVAAGAAEAPADLLRRYDMLWIRLAALEAGNPGAPAHPALAAVRAGLPGLFATMRPLEGALSAMLAGEDGALARADALLGEIVGPLADANRALHRDRQIAAEAVAAGLLRLHATFSLSALGLIVSTTVLCVLLFWLWRRTRALLQGAEAAQARAGRSERLLRVVVDALPVMVSAHDPAGRFVLANAALAEFHGTTEAALLGQGIAAATGAPEDAAAIAAVLAGGENLPFREVEALRADGAARILLTTTAPVNEAGGAVSAVARICVDITERKAAEEQIRYMAEHDSLTGLANRLLFTRGLSHALAAGGHVALHLIDLDDFKEVNDSLGHAAGDALLLEAAGRMRACLPPGCLLARLGGDEFAVVQAGITEEGAADALAARLIRALAQPHGIDGAQVSAGASIGIATSPADGVDGQALLQRADIALYRAKAAGRGQARCFSASMAAALTEQRQLETDVQQALARHEFHFAYQPKFRLADLGFAGCEALLRWDHPLRGAVPPGVFIPAAEASGLATRLAQTTLRMALRQQAAWRAQGLDIAVAVNLSARHIVSGQAPALVRDALEAEEGRADRLEIEVTEDVFIRDPEAAARVLAKLRDIGVRLALDDFGTGYASLGYLQQLPFDVIKLDRSFVAGLGTSPRTERIVDAVARIAHGLGARLVAEGVESAVQLARLRDIGCDEGQGYLLGRPMAPDALAALAQGAGPTCAAPAVAPTPRRLVPAE